MTPSEYKELGQDALEDYFEWMVEEHVVYLAILTVIQAMIIVITLGASIAYLSPLILVVGLLCSIIWWAVIHGLIWLSAYLKEGLTYVVGKAIHYIENKGEQNDSEK